MKRTAMLLATLVPFAITGCSTPQGERQIAIAWAEAHCDGEGKQFILGNIEQTRVTNGGKYYMIVSGHCVGPGDRGNAPPPKTTAN